MKQGDEAVMDSKQITQEQISALADGEAGETEAGLALAALRTEEGRARWAAYHRVGDRPGRWEPRARKRRPRKANRLMQPRDIAKLPHNRSKWF